MIQRVWIGKEMEGFCAGKETLFVQSQEISVSDVFQINKIADEYKVACIYIGAGAVDTKISTDALQRLKAKGITYEISEKFLDSNTEIAKIEPKEKISIVIRISSCIPTAMLETANIKIQNGTDCMVYRKGVLTNLASVKCGMYKGVDKEIKL
jgi:hypothetical protein